MNQSDTVYEFKEGLSALQDGYHHSAVVHLRNAVEHDGGNPFYLSYYGLALGRAERNWAQAEKACVSALQMKRNHALLYLNLAEVYRQAGELEEALLTLYSGLQFTKWDSRLVRVLEEMGVRRPPVLSFLRRKHFLNRHLGKLRHWFEGQDKVSALERLRAARN